MQKWAKIFLTTIVYTSAQAETIYVKTIGQSPKRVSELAQVEGVLNLNQIGWKIIDSDRVSGDFLSRIKSDWITEMSSKVFLQEIPQSKLPWGILKIGSPLAWNVSIGSRQVKVAIIDSGMDLDHKALSQNLWVNPLEIPGNGIDDDGNGYVDDLNGWDYYSGDNVAEDKNGHGSHVAGTIGGYSEKDKLSGVTQEISLIPLKIFGRSGSAKTEHAAQAIIYAADIGAKVINASWGGYTFSEMLRDSISYAQNKGVLFVAAAGNDSRSNDKTPMFPASYDLDSVVSVASVSKYLNLSVFSNYGVEAVDIAAPGQNIKSAWLGGKYKELNGTSMASPHVAGTAALLLSVDPSLSYLELKDLMLQTVTHKSSLTDKVSSGGVVNVGTAMERLHPSN